MDPDGSRFSPAFSAFVEEHAADNPAELLLARGRWPELDLGLAADCIRSRQKLRTKAPEWCREGVYCPLPLSAEQCSGEAAARYKAGLAARLLRERDEARLGGRAEGRGQDSVSRSGPAEGRGVGPVFQSGTVKGRGVGTGEADFVPKCLTEMEIGTREADFVPRGLPNRETGTKRVPFVPRGLPNRETGTNRAGFVPKYLTGRIADLTGGLGVDALAFSRTGAQVCYNERNPLLAEAAAHNFPLLTTAPVSISCEEIQPGNIDALLSAWQPDLVYMDPARRGENGRKVFRLEDCSPDVLPLRDAVLGRGATLLLKLSPMADISLLAAQLGPSVREVHVVEAEGECKELLFVLRPGAAGDGYRIHVTRCGPNASPEKFGNMQEKPRLTADHPGENAIWSFLPEEERSAQVAPLPEGAFTTMQPQWMFLPGKALLKSGAFRLTASVLGLSPAGPSSHCYFRFSDDGNKEGRICAQGPSKPGDRNKKGPICAQVPSELGDRHKEDRFCAQVPSEPGDGNKKSPICAQGPSEPGDGNKKGPICAQVPSEPEDGNKEGHFCAQVPSEPGDGNKKGPICAQVPSEPGDGNKDGRICAQVPSEPGDGNKKGPICAQVPSEPGDGNKSGHFCAQVPSEPGDGNREGPICAQATPAKLGSWWEVVCAEPLSKQAVRRFGAAFPEAEATVRDLPMRSEELQRKLRRSHSTAPDRPKTDGIHIFALRCALPAGPVPMLIAARRLFPDK